MKIREIQIENFKGFSNNTFLLNEHFTVIIGENATGKTSLLDALAIAAGSFLLGIDYEKVKSRTILPNEIRRVMSVLDGQPRLQKPVMIQAKGNIDEISYTWKREMTREKTTYKGASNIKQLVESKLRESRNPNGKPVVFPVIAYHGTCRLCAEHEKIDFQKQEEGVVMAYTNCLSVKSSSKEFLSWYKTQEDSISKFQKPLDIAHLKALKETILALVPDQRWTDIAFDRKADDLVGIFLDHRNEKNYLAYSQLSDGFRNIIKLAADIAYRCIQLNPSLGENAVRETPGIVLIDEIDLHLHPNWQKRIVGDLKRCFPKIQFVATTHSPFIVQSLKDEELIRLGLFTKDELDGDPQNHSIEDIAEVEMGVEDVQRSRAFLERTQVAGEYFRLIKEGRSSKDDADVMQLRQKLNDLELLFGNDPVFVAQLEAERKLYNL